MSDLSFGENLAVLGVAFALAAALNNPLWQDPEAATKTLEDAGYQVTEVGGYGWLSCGKGDMWRTEFKAKNQNGKDISGTVCEGIFKGSTIRFD